MSSSPDGAVGAVPEDAGVDAGGEAAADAGADGDGLGVLLGVEPEPDAEPIAACNALAMSPVGELPSAISGTSVPV